VAVSEPAADFAQQCGIQIREIIPNMVGATYFGPTSPRSSNSKPQIVFLGRLVERKGAMHLLEAVKLLRQQGVSNFAVRIGGDGPLRAKLENFVDQNELRRVVTFDGYIDESKKVAYLSKADIAVFPALGGESFGIVLIEAMAAGSRVVLGGNNPGYAAVLAHSDVLFDPLDSSDLARAMNHYLHNKKAIDHVRARQRKQVQSFGVDVVGRRIEKWYKNVLDAAV
jgi:phosphatidylinositol alpha-mannosyltransferase